MGADLPTKKPAPPPIPVPVLPSTWHFEFTGYVWGSSLSGYAGVGPFPALPFYANFAKVIEHFDGALMGAATVSNGTFIVGVDFNWSRLTGAETFQDPTSRLYGMQGTLKLAEAVATAQHHGPLAQVDGGRRLDRSSYWAHQWSGPPAALPVCPC